MTASAAFAGGDHGIVTNPAFSRVALDSPPDSVTLPGTDTQLTPLQQLQSDNRDHGR